MSDGCLDARWRTIHSNLWYMFHTECRSLGKQILFLVDDAIERWRGVGKSILNYAYEFWALGLMLVLAFGSELSKQNANRCGVEAFMRCAVVGAERKNSELSQKCHACQLNWYKYSWINYERWPNGIFLANQLENVFQSERNGQMCIFTNEKMSMTMSDVEIVTSTFRFLHLTKKKA